MPTATPSRCSWKSDLTEIESEQMQTELLASARLPEGKTLPAILGRCAL